MKSFMTKFGGLQLLTILVLLAATSGIIAAQNTNEEEGKTEVLTPLQQQMQKTISIKFRDTPIDDVIRAIADKANVDIIKSPQVIGTVTVTLTDVPLGEALDNILAAHGYGYVAGKNVIRIAPISELAQKAEMLVSRIYRITYADVTDVEKTLTKFLSQRGSLAASISTSNIIVTDTENRIKAIDTFIAEIDRITPQILVEVRIYDITVQDKMDLGIEWVAGRNTTLANTIGGDPSGTTNPFFTGGFGGAVDKTAAATQGFLRFGVFTTHVDIDARIRAEREDIHAKLLANPRILVLDNETALFDIVTEHPYVERTIEGGITTETVMFKQVGTKLQVTPHVTRDGMVRLHIQPEFGVKVGDVVLTAGAGTVPIVDTRKVDTIALVQDGQTVVIGGLRKKEVRQQTNKIPLLGDLPVIGVLFRFEGEDVTNSELVVFITPRIIEHPGLSEVEEQAYKITEFNGPIPITTRMEKEVDAEMNKE